MSKIILEWDALQTKRRSGEEKVKCPNCNEKRTNKQDRSFSVNHDKGVGHCHYCEAIAIKKDKSFVSSEKFYFLPNQEWQNHTKLSDKLVKWISNERKIRQETLIDFCITEERHYQPALNAEVNNIVFNYFEGETIVNKKYRSGGKKFTQTKDGKPILYNINAAIGADELWVVEGEFDVLALAEAGIKNAVSIPNGANDSNDYWVNSERYLKSVKKFIIATDSDEKGIAVREKIAHRLGMYRCEYVEFEGKDANEDLVNGVLDKSVKNRKRFPIGGTFTVMDLMDKLKALHKNGLPKTLFPKKECFGDLKEKFSTMRGHLLVTTGIPSHGKSTFIEWYLLNLIEEYGMKASFFSPEHRPIELHLSTFARLAVGKPFFGEGAMTEVDIERFSKWSNDKIYFSSPDDGDAPDWDWVLDTFKAQMYAYGIDIFVVDAFNKVLLPKGSNKKDSIDDVLTRLTTFSQANNVLFVLVAHPTKMQKKENGLYDVPSLYDVSGSADFRNQTHDGLCVYRHFGNDISEGFNEIINLKTKYTFQGEIGAKTQFDYDVTTGRFFARGYPKFYGDLTIDGYFVKPPKQATLDEDNNFKPVYSKPSDAFVLEDLKEDEPF